MIMDYELDLGMDRGMGNGYGHACVLWVMGTAQSAVRWTTGCYDPGSYF